ncbi:FAD-dependent oxidoreductase [Desulfallas thermosapovorans]|uniref:Heterodisulfide reductase subunit A n=1 Tax=Desulfallas thermosapovorans DSM 6562 TaxID=1121431 RepID=A0A5S4ZRW3_9FIRM|nr:FAD-dependent oxidoreductase [Desulfallas thermosapovorans]TYO95396.1 heterodisulfide reductase subunit A [Desulfallas thermosapovorans DSM 6562]
MTQQKIGAVLVVGGGVTGIQAALDLAESGYYVYLVENSPAIGGVMAQLDKTFPTNDCSMCILSPKLVESGRHGNIELITNAWVDSVQGETGNFTVSLRVKPRYVDVDKCVSCGVCAEKCPVKVPDRFNAGLSGRKAIYTKYAQAVPSAYVIDSEHCLYLTRGREKGKDICKLCVKHCKSNAIDFSQVEQIKALQVGAIILSSGFEPFNPRDFRNYGYGTYPNVLTSIEFERILSASGPTAGHLVRPSDGRTPRRIAWIQCVGSRDVAKSGNAYCSSVCCTYALKEAIVALEHAHGELDTTIFYMDMRTFGKDFERYLERAKYEFGVRLVRSRIFALEQGEDQSLAIRYALPDGRVQTGVFDLVVLSVGLEPAKYNIELSGKLGVRLNKYGFCQYPNFNPVSTSQQGIFACGAFQGPMSIPRAVVQASAAAGNAAALLTEVRNTLVRKQSVTPERDVSGQEPRVGVFVCRCGINIGAVVDVPEVVEFARGLPGVVHAEECLFACSQDNQQNIKQLIAGKGLNRVVVASCTPRTHEPMFRQTLREAGLNPYLFEMANIREHCSWVHSGSSDVATQKAKSLVKRAVSRVVLQEPLYEIDLGVKQAALVVGGGVAGMECALDLARQGIKVYLLEKRNELGGLTRRIHYTMDRRDVKSYLRDLTAKVMAHPLIEVHCNAVIDDVYGYVGNYVTGFTTPEGKRKVNHGVAVIAIGGEEYKPVEYLYGQDPRVMTCLDLEGLIWENSALLQKARNVVMIQCVGSREPQRPYCSRVCCSESVKNAIKLKESYPLLNVFVLCRDMRTYGFFEGLYQKARRMGVIFIKYAQDSKPQVEQVPAKGGTGLQVTVTDHVLGQPVVINADIVALAAAILAPEDGAAIAGLFKVPRNDEGFFLEAHVKLRPVDFTTDGVFMCGLAHAPKLIDESIAQGKAAAARAMTVLSSENLVAGGVVSVIDKDKCSGCRICVGLCPYSAISFNEELKVAEINQVLCKGCGVCASACPTKACSTRNFSDEIILAEIEALCT